MRKYKFCAGFLSLAMACSLIMPVSAEDYSDTEAWYAKCSQAQTSQAGVKAFVRDFRNIRRIVNKVCKTVLKLILRA